MRLPLIEGYTPEAAIVSIDGVAVSQSQFLAAAATLAARLPAESEALLPLTRQRAHFLLVFAAALIAGKPCLLPSSGHAATLAALREQYPTALVFDDREGLEAREARFDCGEWRGAVPEIPADQLAAIAFTSGSTGAPSPQRKTWAALIAVAHSARARFGSRIHIAATVPPQHLYGLETTVMMALAAGCTIDAGQPFYPLDVQAALASLPAPRLLVTTPVHLRALLAAGTELPPLAMVISATAPLPVAIASEAEQTLGAPLFEIYGCTEAGSLATRRTTRDTLWQLYTGLALEARADGHWLSGEALAPVRLSDDLETVDATHFKLLGRSSEVLKVAGKRLDLAALTEALLAVPGVQDAVVVLPEGDAVNARPAALVVAPETGESAILAALSERFDAVFLPRPLKKVAALPRNAVGKMPRATLLELLRG